MNCWALDDPNPMIEETTACNLFIMCFVGSDYCPKTNNYVEKSIRIGGGHAFV